VRLTDCPSRCRAYSSATCYSPLWTSSRPPVPDADAVYAGVYRSPRRSDVGLVDGPFAVWEDVTEGLVEVVAGIVGFGAGVEVRPAGVGGEEAVDGLERGKVQVEVDWDSVVDACRLAC
jgi:hypothetical protein